MKANTLRERLMEVMLQWGGSISDLLSKEGIDEWVDDLEAAVRQWAGMPAEEERESVSSDT